ncbi:restriction endonuclease subunit S [Nevskia sp.]|uniref:restriction endonuclease subunit S n=1 Tax=Nevskia sp. TaxID=1929292 RepID=UPI002601264F|nr:restriction endonuclease subunit S [Nevskia sp.]
MSHYKPYPAYRDSGVEWVGRVPDHWEIKPICRLASCNDDSLPENVHPDQVLRYVDISSVNHTDGITDVAEMRFADAPSRARRKAKAGDVVISTVRTYLKAVAAVTETHADCTYSTGFAVLRPRLSEVESPFLKWLALNDLVIQAIEAHSEGLSYPAINAPELVKLKAVVPPRTEQTAISAVLDRETARIDALITKKTRFIELLKEKRQALITHAVTKGLDPNVKMKDSGVEWIGEVPEHWEISKLAYTTREAGGKTPDTKNQAYWDGNVPWVSPKDMKQSEIVDAIDKISDAAVSDCGMKLFEPGTILAVVRGMILAHSFPVAELKVPATINQDMKALEPDKRIRPNYLRLILETAKDYVVSVLVAEAAHGTRVLRTDVWRQLPALLPPVDEQDLILAELDRVITMYAKLVQKVECSIALLKERRSALITAAVTGQIDLREAA